MIKTHLNVVFLFLLLCSSLTYASDLSGGLVSEGREALFNSGNPTCSGVLAADARFQQAIEADATDQEANFFHALTSLAVSGLETTPGAEIGTLLDLAQTFGITRNTNDVPLDGPIYTDPPFYHDAYKPPGTVPMAGEVVRFWQGPFLTLLNDILDNKLSRIESTFNIDITSQETEESQVEIDWGDILTISAYDMDGIDTAGLIQLAQADIFKIQQDLLDQYPQALSLVDDGAARLVDAKDTLVSAIDDFQAALEFISNETDDQMDDLFSFNEEDFQEAQFTLAHLLEAKDSLAEDRPAVYRDEHEEIDSLNLNGIFGSNSKDFLDIRAVLPDFNILNEPVRGSFPEYPNPGDPVLNGICPDLSTNRDLTLKENLQPSGTFTIPVVPPASPIVLDGNPADWITLSESSPLFFIDITQEEESLLPSMDISRAYLARDENYLYMALEVANGDPFVPSQGGYWNQINYNINLRTFSGDIPEAQLNLSAGYDMNQAAWVVKVAEYGSQGWQERELFGADAVAPGIGFIEWRVPLWVIENRLGSFAGKFMTVHTSNYYNRLYGGFGPRDYNHTLIQLNPVASVTGNLVWQGGPTGRMILKVMSGPDPGTASIYKSIHLDAPGAFTIPCLASTNEPVYLFVFHDSDGNGVLTNGEASHVSSPFDLGGAVDLGEILLGPDTLDLWLQNRASVYTYADWFTSSLHTVHRTKEIWIDRRDGSAEIHSPGFFWEAEERVESVHTDIDQHDSRLPDVSVDHNTPDPEYRWTDLPDFLTGLEWYGVKSARSVESSVYVNADLKRSVDNEIFTEPGEQTVTLDVIVHDPSVRRFKARIYFDDRAIAQARDNQGDPDQEYVEFRVDDPVAGEKYTYTRSLWITPENTNGNPVRYIPRTSLGLYYPCETLEESFVFKSDRSITVLDNDIGDFTISYANPVFWNQIEKETGRVEVEQRGIIEEINAQPPYLAAVMPVDGDTEVKVLSFVEIKFSEPMDTPTVENGFEMMDENHNWVHSSKACVNGGSFVWENNDTTMLFAPRQSLKPGTGYQVMVQGRDKASEWTRDDLQWNFVTAPDGSDTIPPVVISVFPVNGGDGVSTAGHNPYSLFTHISVMFSEAMDIASLKNEDLELQDSAGNPVPFAVSYRFKTLEIIPDAPLAPFSEYSVIIPAAVKDAAGNGLGTPFSWSFTTGESDTVPPVVVRTTPVNHAGDMDVWDPGINIFFSEELDPDSITDSSVYITDREGIQLDFYSAYSYKEHGIRLRRGASRKFLALDTESEYTVHITTGVTDRAGNPLAEPYELHLTTISGHGNSAPSLHQVRNFNVSSFPDAFKIEADLYAEDNDSHWPGERLTASISDNSGWTGTMTEIPGTETFEYHTAGDASEGLIPGIQTFFFMVRDSAGNVVEQTIDRFIFSQHPLILSPLESAEIPGPVIVEWTDIDHAQVYHVAIYDGPDPDMDHVVWESYVSDTNGLLTLPEDAGIGFNKDYHVRVRAISLDSGSVPLGYSCSEMVGFTRITPDFDGDQDVDGVDLAALAAEPELMDITVFAANFGR
jgi:hypothetical protein